MEKILIDSDVCLDSLTGRYPHSINELTPKSRLKLVSIQKLKQYVIRYFKPYFVYSNFINNS